VGRASGLGWIAAMFGAIMLAFSAPAAAQQYSDGYKFLKAVEDKDGDKARELLDEPGSTVINSRDITSGRTGMHIAVSRRDLTWIRFLAGRGANPNIADKRGVTPMMLATQLGFVEGVEGLVAAGARVDDPNQAGETPLIYAVHRRDVPLMRVLLEAGANPDRRDNSGRSARDYASQAGAGNTVLAEIERSAKDDDGEQQAPAAAAPTYGPSF